MHDESGFSRRLDAALKARGVRKMYALAVALEVDESALSRWRRGKPISVGNLIRLAGHLRVSIDWLLTGAGPMDATAADSDGVWRAELIDALASLDPGMRQHFAEIMRHVAKRPGPRDR